MSKIANITMVAALAASAAICGTVSASAHSYYGPNASPYPSFSKAARSQGNRNDANQSGSDKRGTQKPAQPRQ